MVIEMDMATALVLGFNEFGGALLGDLRRCKRAARIAAGLICNLGAAISSSCGGGGAQAVSRFFDCDDVTEDSILSGHQVQIGERCKQQEGRILVAQDTTTIDFSGRTNIYGLGPTSPNGGNGIMMHSGLVMNEQRLPIGILGLRLWCRDAAQRGVKKLRKKRNTMEKESAKWIWGLEQVSKQLSGLGKEIVLIGDRESDMYDLFAYDRPSDVHLLVRMTENRIVEVNDELTKMYGALDESLVLGSYDFEVPNENRTAKLEVRSCSMVVCPPKDRKPITSNTVKMWAVEIREVDAPEDVVPLHWRLLTTLDASSFESCRYIIACYGARWSIEEFHKTLKTGCGVERLQLESVSRLRPAIALLSVVAQQVMYLTRYTRCYPDAPASCIANQEEQETVEIWVQNNRFANYDVANVSDYVRGIGFIGGFRGRKHDGEPGVKPIWEGLRNLANLIAGRRIERRRAAQT
jgi:hypothetical protein